VIGGLVIGGMVIGDWWISGMVIGGLFTRRSLDEGGYFFTTN
jgi:hypothetical protein